MPNITVGVHRELAPEDRAALESRGYRITHVFGQPSAAHGEPPLDDSAWKLLNISSGYGVSLDVEDAAEARSRVATALGLTDVEAISLLSTA